MIRPALLGSVVALAVSRPARLPPVRPLPVMRSVGLISALALWMTASAAAGNGVRIDDLVVASAIPDAQRDATVTAARAFYDFWNTGDAAFLKRAIADHFTDHTLPAGRPQGPEGPAFASRQFRAAVPDLQVTVEKMIVAGDYVTVHMNFTGRFTGRFGRTQGNGQPITFIATDLLKIENGRITDNWHIEDNLTLLQQMGVAKLDP
jgi:predicted ester cyclase